MSMPNINAIRNRGMAALLALSLPMAAQAISLAETFENPTAPGWNLSGTAALTGTPGSPGWLRLTSAGNNQAGSAIYNTAFSNGEGVQVTFEYAVFGGSGADGFSFYLIDGAESSPQTGFSGGALGYAGQISPPQSGVKSGYVGIGFDVYGAFSTSAVGGCVELCGQKPNRLAIRGQGSGAATANNFKLLASAQPVGGIGTGSLATPKSARITITKVTALNPFPSITVELRNSGSTTWTKVIDALSLAANGPVPATFKMGFSASTGGLNNNHMVRGTTVTNADGSTLVMDLSGLPTAAYVGDAYSGSFSCTNPDNANLPNGVCDVTSLPANLSVASCTLSPGNTPWSTGNAVPANGMVACSVAGTPTTAGTANAQGSYGSSVALGSQTRQIKIASVPQMSMDVSNLTMPQLGQPYSGTWSCNPGTGELLANPANACTVPALEGLAGMNPAQCMIGAMAWNPGDAIPAGETVQCSLAGTPTAQPGGPVTGQAGTAGGTAGTTFASASLAPLNMDLSGLPVAAYVGDLYSGTFTCINPDSVALPSGVCNITSLPANLSVASCNLSPGNTPWSAGNAVPSGSTVTCSVAGTPTTAGPATAQGSFGSGTTLGNRTRQINILAAPQMSMAMSGLPRPHQGQPYSGTYSCSNAAGAGDLVANPANVCTVPALASLPGMNPVQCAIGAMPWNPGDAIPAGATVTCTLTGIPAALPAGPVTGQAGMPGGTPGSTSAAAALAPAPAGVASVPALSHWGLAMMAVLLGTLGFRRRQA